MTDLIDCLLYLIQFCIVISSGSKTVMVHFVLSDLTFDLSQNWFAKIIHQRDLWFISFRYEYERAAQYNLYLTSVLLQSWHITQCWAMVT